MAVACLPQPLRASRGPANFDGTSRHNRYGAWPNTINLIYALDLYHTGNWLHYTLAPKLVQA